MSALFDVLTRPGQGRSDIVRRSGGLPHAFCALFLAEPCGTNKTLLPSGMRRLMVLARGEEAPLGPWPRVHALNVLRMAFEIRQLLNDASAFFAEGIQVLCDGYTLQTVFFCESTLIWNS